VAVRSGRWSPLRGDEFRQFVTATSISHKRREVLAVIVGDVGGRRHPDRVDDTVDHSPAVGFQTVFRCQQNLTSVGVDDLVALDTAELRVRKALVAKAGDEDPLQRFRAAFELVVAFLVRFLPLLFAMDCSLDIITGIDYRLQDVDEVATLVTNRVAESGHIVAVPMTVTPDDVGRDVSRTDDIRIEARKVEFVNVLVQADFRCEDEPTTVVDSRIQWFTAVGRSQTAP